MNKGKLDILNRIRNNYNKLSKGQRLIADYIMENYDKVAFMTASKLGEKVGVSESTVVRFANALEYGGYPKLQKELQELIKNKLTTVQRLELSKDLNDEEDTIKKVMRSDLDNVRKTIEDIDTTLFQTVIDHVLNANKVYILGLRSSTVLAEYLGFYMNFILDNVAVVPSGINDIFDQLVNIREDDLIIGISFPRYSNKTIDALTFAKEQNCTVIGITDSPFSPINNFSKYTLIARSNMTSFVDSLVAPMSLINALIIGLSMKKKDKITNNFKTLENIWEEYNIYLKK